MLRFWMICMIVITSLAACEKQKQASAEVGAVPKQILDKATQDINAAQKIAEDNMKAMENVDAPSEANK